MEPGATRGSVVIGDSKRQALSAQEEQAILNILNSLMSALGKFQQYPTINQVVLDAMNESSKHLNKWLRTHNRFECVNVQGNLQVNNAILSMPSQQKDFVQAFIFFLTERNVRTFEVRRGINLSELQSFFEFFSKPAKEIVGKKNIARALKRKGVKHVGLSRELVMENVVVKTEISHELHTKLSRLNIDELVEKANVISQLDLNTLYKVGDLATMITNLHYTKNEDMSSKIIQRLSQTLHDDNPKSRLLGARAFTQIADKAVDYTLYGLHSEVGDMMADQLARENDPQVYTALAKSLEKSAQVHIAKGDYDQAMKVIQSFEGGASKANAGSAMQRRAESAISNIANPATIAKLIDQLEGDNEKTKIASIDLLGQIGKKAVPDLIDLIYTTDDQWVLDSAAEILMEIGQPALNELYIELGEDMDDRFRAAIIRVIGVIGDVRSVIKIMPFITHENMAVVRATFDALLKIGGPAAENKVLEGLSSFKYEAEFFKQCVIDMGANKSKGLVPALLELLHGKGPFAQYAGPEVEEQAVRSLSQIGGPEVVTGLCEVLQTKKGFLGLGKGNEKLEVAAANALGRLKDKSAEPALRKAAKSKLKTVRSAAELALRHLSKAGPDDQTVIAEPPHTAAAEPSFPTAGAAEPTVLAQPAEDESATVMETPEDEGATVMEPAAGNPVRLVLTVGPTIIDNVRITIPGVDEQGKTTESQQGALFDLSPGAYQVMIKDQGMEVTKDIEVEPDSEEVRIDLQDIFNF